ncbi:hypothetical protein, partial [Streptococcus sp. DD11]|uniref:hypothetical protein n=1 Tax=Streptococcus sp. DD11 TaxID=1777879 RepID=UPI0019D03153
ASTVCDSLPRTKSKLKDYKKTNEGRSESCDRHAHSFFFADSNLHHQTFSVSAQRTGAEFISI